MLTFDRRAIGVQPGLHAFIVGVSQYDHLAGGIAPKENTYGMPQIPGAARTAARLARFLINQRDQLSPPLRTCRLLLAPSEVEEDEINKENTICTQNGGTPLQYAPARLNEITAALLEWQADAKERPTDATLFFFSGHGIQQTVGTSFLLLQDFLAGAQPLDHALDFLNIYNGMRNGGVQPDMSRTQLYFVDACRNSLDALQEYETLAGAQIFMVKRKGTDDRVAPMFFSSVAGHNAYILDPKGLSLFGNQLLRCLGEAADKRVIEGKKQWVVTIGRLAGGLAQLAAQFNRAKTSRVQTFNFDKYTDIDVPLHVLDAAPEVELVLSVDPEAANQFAQVTVTHPVDPALTLCSPLDPHPYPRSIKAGGYGVNVQVKPGQSYVQPDLEYISVIGPRYEYIVSCR
jgi:hypothetical protein